MILRFRHSELVKAISDNETGITKGEVFPIEEKIHQIRKAICVLQEADRAERDRMNEAMFNTGE